MTKTKKMLISLITAVGFILIACFGVLLIEKYNNRNISQQQSGAALPVRIIRGMTYADYVNNSDFYIDCYDGLAHFQSLTDGSADNGNTYNFASKRVYLVANIDCSRGCLDFGEFCGIFDGNNHMITNFKTDGLFELNYEFVDYNNSKNVATQYFKNYETDGFVPVVSNLYLDRVCLYYNNSSYGEVSPFISFITSQNMPIVIKNCGVSHIIVEESRDYFTITGFVHAFFGWEGMIIKFKDCYIDSRVYYWDSETKEPIDYIIGPQENRQSTGGDAIWIDDCYCYNDSEDDLPWSIFDLMEDGGWQHEKDVPKDHAIKKASSIGGFVAPDGNMWYKHTAINNGKPIPRPLIEWVEVRFLEESSSAAYINSFTPDDKVYIPMLNPFEYSAIYSDLETYLSLKVLSKTYKKSTVTIWGNPVAVSFEKSDYEISNCTWTLKKRSNGRYEFDFDKKSNMTFIEYEMSVTATRAYYTLKVLKLNNHVCVSANGELINDEESFKIKKKDKIYITLETYNGRTITKKVQPRPDKTETYTVTLIKKITYSFFIYDLETNKKEDKKLEIVYELFDPTLYYLEDLYFDKDTTTYHQPPIKNTEVKSNMTLSFEACLKDYSVTIK